MEKLKVFLDSNVVFSAAYSEKGKSRSYIFFELQNLNIIKIYISNLVKFESIHNIKIKKPEKLDFFITGNTKDFLTFYNKKLKNTLILTPQRFFRINFRKIK